MPTHIKHPSVIEAAGNKPKRIEEFIGRVNSKTSACSVARMKSPSGWVEPGQTPEFDEYTVVLRGSLRVTTRDGVIDVARRRGGHHASRRVGAVLHARRRKAPNTSRSVCRHSSDGHACIGTRLRMSKLLILNEHEVEQLADDVASASQ